MLKNKQIDSLKEDSKLREAMLNKQPDIQSYALINQPEVENSSSNSLTLVSNNFKHEIIPHIITKEIQLPLEELNSVEHVNEQNKRRKYNCEILGKRKLKPRNTQKRKKKDMYETYFRGEEVTTIEQTLVGRIILFLKAQPLMQAKFSNIKSYIMTSPQPILKTNGRHYMGNWDQILLGCLAGMEAVDKISIPDNMRDSVWKLNEQYENYLEKQNAKIKCYIIRNSNRHNKIVKQLVLNTHLKHKKIYYSKINPSFHKLLNGKSEKELKIMEIIEELQEKYRSQITKYAFKFAKELEGIDSLEKLREKFGDEQANSFLESFIIHQDMIAQGLKNAAKKKSKLEKVIFSLKPTTLYHKRLANISTTLEEMKGILINSELFKLNANLNPIDLPVNQSLDKSYENKSDIAPSYGAHEEFDEIYESDN